MRRAGQLQSQTEKRVASPHERVKSRMLLLLPLYSHRRERRTLHASRSRKEQRQQRRRRLQPNWNDVLFFLSISCCLVRPALLRARTGWRKNSRGWKKWKNKRTTPPATTNEDDEHRDDPRRRWARTVPNERKQYGARRLSCCALAPLCPLPRASIPLSPSRWRAFSLSLSLSPSDTRLVYGSFDFVSQQVAHHVIPSDGHLNSCLVNFQMPQFYEGLNYIIVVGIRRNYSKFIYEISWIDIDRNIRHHFKQHYYPKFWRQI